MTGALTAALLVIVIMVLFLGWGLFCFLAGVQAGRRNADDDGS